MRRLRAILVLGAGAMICALPAWSIPANPGPPPRPGTMTVYGAYIAIVILMLIVGAGAFKPAKRTHQD